MFQGPKCRIHLNFGTVYAGSPWSMDVKALAFPAATVNIEACVLTSIYRSSAQRQLVFRSVRI